MATTKVTFNTDVYPYCKGDVVALEKEELARVDAVIEARGLEDAYTSGAHPVKGAKDGRELDINRARDARDATLENNIDTAAVLEAQRNSIPEPANVDALGLIQETPTQTVTGTAPANVEVANPQEVTDPGKDVEADVKVVKA